MDDTTRGAGNQDWLTALEQVESYEDIGVEQGVRERVDDTDTGYGRVYDVQDADGQIDLESAESLREDGVSLLGHIILPGDFQGPAMDEFKEELIRENQTGYIGEMESRRGDYPGIEVPTDYDPDTLDETINAAIQIVQQYQETQDRLEDTLEQQADKHL